MASELVAAIRNHPALKLSLRYAAIELAHKADDSGTIRVSYDYLKDKLNSCKRTAIRMIAWLVAKGILSKTVTCLGRSSYHKNTYHFLVPFRRSPAPAQTFSGDNRVFLAGFLDKMPPILPKAKASGMKELSLREEIEKLERGQRYLTPGSDLFEASEEEIRRLKSKLNPVEDLHAQAHREGETTRAEAGEGATAAAPP